jgi:hypothetical protein
LKLDCNEGIELVFVLGASGETFLFCMSGLHTADEHSGRFLIECTGDETETLIPSKDVLTAGLARELLTEEDSLLLVKETSSPMDSVLICWAPFSIVEAGPEASTTFRFPEIHVDE